MVLALATPAIGAKPGGPPAGVHLAHRFEVERDSRVGVHAEQAAMVWHELLAAAQAIDPELASLREPIDLTSAARAQIRPYDLPQVCGKPSNVCPAESSTIGLSPPSGMNTPSISLCKATGRYRPSPSCPSATNNASSLPVPGSMPRSR